VVGIGVVRCRSDEVAHREIVVVSCQPSADVGCLVEKGLCKTVVVFAEVLE
jgi:hypothetical protein